MPPGENLSADSEEPRPVGEHLFQGHTGTCGHDPGQEPQALTAGPPRGPVHRALPHFGRPWGSCARGPSTEIAQGRVQGGKSRFYFRVFYTQDMPLITTSRLTS